MYDFDKDGNFKGKLDESEIEKVKALLIGKEQAVAGFKLAKGSAIFTDKRLVLITSPKRMRKKLEYTHISYKTVQIFSTEGVDLMDKDAVLNLLLRSGFQLRFEFSGETKLPEICRHIATAII